MREAIESALRSSRADYTEIRLEESERTTVSYRGRDLETAGAVIDAGGIVRCLVRNAGWGVATFNNRDDLAGKVQQAFDCARVGHVESPIDLAPIPAAQQSTTVRLERDFRGVSLAEKKALVEGYNTLMRTFHDKVIDTYCAYRDTFTRLTFANSQGAFVEEERPESAIMGIAFTRDGDNVQQAYESEAGPYGFERVVGREEIMEQAASRAVELLSAEPVVGGSYTVVIDPRLAGVFIHEAFGHLSEADFVYENAQAKEMMVLGRRFGQDILTVFDDGTVAGLRGTHPFDDEGAPTGRAMLIDKGILVGRLHSRETAARMGEAPTGNARAINYRFAPIVRMTNTAIAPGSTSFEDMIKDIPLGIYACDAYGGETMLENFSFSSAYAYMIRDGKLAEMVKDVVLAGNLFSTLLAIDAVGNDFRWFQSGGGCGKGGQMPLPVAMGAPHVRIRDVVIGGR